MPFGRADAGRTGFLALLDLSFSYDIKLGRNTLQLNINVDNALNTRTAMSVQQYYNQGAADVSEEELLSTDWDIDEKDIILDPRFMKDRWLYGDGLRGNPFRVRFGFKFSF